MRTVVAVKDIIANPYQARKHMNRDAIKALSEEIRNFGLWPGALKGRWKNGKLELCYGHRRLEAVRSLGWDEVEVEIVDMDDDEMALQSLAENLQREGLSDVEKAEGMNMMVKRYMKGGMSETDALAKVGKQLGLSVAWIKDLLSLLRMEPEVQKAIREQKIAGRTALEAHRLGGKEMVRTAAKHGLAVHTLSKISQKIRRIPDDKLRERIKGEVVKGKIVEPTVIEEKASKLIKTYKIGKKAAPENVKEVAAEWLRTLEEWEEKVGELILYSKYFDRLNGTGPKIRKRVNGLLQKLRKV
jgi:ParB family chromosome partitioning protein